MPTLGIRRQVLILLSLVCGLGLASVNSGELTAIAQMPTATATFAIDLDKLCKNVLDRAVSLTQQNCEDTGRNQACYGYTRVNSELRENSDNPPNQFDHSGDILGLRYFTRIQTEPLNPTSGSWGMAVMKLQANLPDTNPGQNVTFILFGDTDLHPDLNHTNSFYLSTDLGNLTCRSLPTSSVIVRAPKGMTVEFTLNDVQIKIASIVLFRNDSKQLLVRGLEGHIEVSSFGSTQTFSAGQQVTVPMAGEVASGIPSLPQNAPFEQALDDLGRLAISLDSSGSDFSGDITLTGRVDAINPAIPSISLGGYLVRVSGVSGWQGLRVGDEVSVVGTFESYYVVAKRLTMLSLTPTGTATPSPTPTVLTPTSTSTPTTVVDPSETPTRTFTLTATATASVTFSATATLTNTYTATSLPTNTPTPTPPPTDTQTYTWTPLPTDTWTPLPTNTPTLRPTNTLTYTWTPAPTDTFTPRPTNTLPPTVTNTPIPPTDTPLPTATNTSTLVPPPTELVIPSPSPSNTVASSPTETLQPTATLTAIPPTQTPRPTATKPPSTRKPTETATATTVAPPALNIQLAALCSPNPNVYRRWSITNLNEGWVLVSWEILGSPLDGSLIIPPRTIIYLSTPTQQGSNVMQLSYQGQVIATEPSSSAFCIRTTSASKTPNSLPPTSTPQPSTSEPPTSIPILPSPTPFEAAETPQPTDPPTMEPPTTVPTAIPTLINPPPNPNGGNEPM